jgi:hypothetical protein
MYNYTERRTITIGPALDAFIQSGGTKGKAVSLRIERLADRYAAMVRDLAPPRLSLTDWELVVQTVNEFELSQAADALILAVRFRQLAKAKPAAQEFSSLAYRLENLKLAELLALIDVAERAIHAGATNSEKLSEWLRQNGIITA